MRLSFVRVASTVLVALLGTSWARAQPLPSVERNAAESGVLVAHNGDEDAHTVTLRGATPNVAWEIDLPEGPTVARCGARGCTMKMKSGVYRLRATRDPAERSVELQVHSDLDLTIRAPSPTRRRAGLATGITGTAVAGSGLSLTVIGLAALPLCFVDILDAQNSDPSDEYAQADNEPDPLCEHNPILLGLALFAGGAVLTPVGWVTYARNRYPRIEPNAPSAPELAAGPHSPRIRLGIQRVGTGYGAGVRASF